MVSMGYHEELPDQQGHGFAAARIGHLGFELVSPMRQWPARGKTEKTWEAIVDGGRNI